MNKFNTGDKVMRRNGYTNTIYTVLNADVQSKDRVVISSKMFPWLTDRVAQNNLRKISRAELSVVNAFGNIIKSVLDGDKKVDEWQDKFEDGDIVMYSFDTDMTMYKVTNSCAQSRGRISVTELGNPSNTIRVSQNSLHKLTKAEMNVIRGYEKLVEDVVSGN